MKTKFIAGLKRFVREEDAPTMVEYGLALVFISLVVVVGAFALAGDINTFLDNAGSTVATETPPALPAN